MVSISLEQAISLFPSLSAYAYFPTPHTYRCCGVLEVARVARAGYPTRYTLEQFAGRYSLLLLPGSNPGEGNSGEEVRGWVTVVHIP